MEPASSILRWEVISMDGRSLGTLTLLRQDGGPELRFTGATPSPLDLEGLRERLHEQSLSDDQLAGMIESVLQAQGLSWNRLPIGDLKVVTVVQLDKLIAASRVEPLHDGMGSESTAVIGNAVHAAMLGALAKLSSDVGDEATALLEADPLRGAKFVTENILHLKGDARRLIELLRRIDRGILATNDRRVVLDAFMALATLTRDFASLLPEIEEARSVFSAPEERRTLLLARANGEGQAGREETARALWESLLADPETDSVTRAWALRGLSTSVHEDPARWAHEERAGDAFLEGGEKLEAAISYLAVARALQFEEQTRSLKLTQRVIDLFSGDTALDDELRASVLHLHAVLLLRTKRSAEALGVIEQAVSLRLRLSGNSGKLWSSLQVAGEAAAASGDRSKAEEFFQRAASLQPQLSGRDALRHELAEAMRTGDRAIVASARAKADAAAHGELTALADVYSVISDSDRPHEEKIQVIERARQALERSVGPRRPMIDNDAELIASAFAEIYLQNHDIQNAVRWYQRVLEVNPTHSVARQNAVAGLVKLKRWDDVIRIIERQIRLFGDKPGMLCVLSEAFLAKGKPSEALETVGRALALNPQNDMKARLLALLQQAIQSGGHALKAHVEAKGSETERSATLRDLEQCLVAFRDHLENDRRMEFWRRDDGGGLREHKWVPGPEALAKSILWAFLEGTFRGAIEILEEVRAGAGRMDMYIRLRGGERVIIELKMLGGGYSSTYAADGIEQLRHYMDSKGTKLGYLVAFDARSRDQGKALSRMPEETERHVQVLMVDVRPEVID